jgi:hypothetical protein
MSILSLVTGAVVFILQYVSFGLILTKFIKIQLSALEKLLIGVFMALSINAASFFLIGHLIGAEVYYLSTVPIIIGLINLKNLKKVLLELMVQIKQQKFIFILALVAAFSMAATLSLSWIRTEQGLVFQAGQMHDSVWHIALIKQLQNDIPPHHPSNFAITVTNYHYFYDLIIAAMATLLQLDVPTIYFQFFPIVLSGLLAGSAIALGKRLGGKKTTSYLLFLTFFAGSFAYLIPLFLPQNTWHDSSFWVTQTFGMMVNPQNILTFALSYVVLLLIHLDLSNRKKFNWSLQAVLILLISTSLGFKSYSFIIFSLIYAIYLLIKLFQCKNWQPIASGLLLTAISIPFLWLITGFKTKSFIYKPLWFIDTMIEAPDRLNHLEWKFLEDHYRLKENWLRVWELKVKEILIFYAGNLGIRIIGVGLVPLLILKKLKTKRIYLLVLIGFLFSSIFPLLFIQRGIVWNSIQFWYYALLFANIFAAVVLTRVHNLVLRLTNQSKVINVIFVLIIIIITIPTVYSVAKIKYFEFDIIPTQELRLIKNIKSDDTILIHPHSKPYFHTALISALTQAQIVYANPVQLILMDDKAENKESKLIELIENNKNNALGQQYKKAKIISHKKLESKQLKMIDQVENQLFLYEL